ncbi:Flp pilus assembly protein CpaB [Oscillospiraceae bacterium WX1]
MKKIRLLALILAVITAGALFYYLSLAGNITKNTPKSNVIVAADDIPENTVMTADMLKLVSVPTDTILPNTYDNATDIVGKTTSAKIIAGEQILSIRLVDVGSTESGTLAYAIEPGMRAITIGVGDTSSLKYMIRPNDTVDIVAQYQVEAENKAIPTAKLLMQNIKVLAVDQVMQKSGSDKYTTLTLEVTPTQAVELSYSENAGLLRAILRSPLDKNDIYVPVITITQILG